MRLVILGTGYAMATRCYNTCFALQQEQEGNYLLIDAGGGNGILRQLEDTKLPIERMHHLFVTHAHTDHALGVVWVARAVAASMQKGTYEGDFTIWCHDLLCRLLEPLCRDLLPESIRRYIGQRIHFAEIQPGDQLEAIGMHLSVFDILSTKAKQYGFRALLPDGQSLTCMGDEPCREPVFPMAQGSDWLLTEAFCLYGDRERFHPYEKNHSTVRDAAQVAQKLQVKHLVLYHTEDKNLATRKVRYASEAATYYSGPIFVPDDLDIISIEK